MIGGEVDRRREEPAFVADLPDLHAGYLTEVENRKRDWHPLRKRSRYRRCSTLWNGHVLPFTMMQSPKNSGFQIGENGPCGMDGPSMLSKSAACPVEQRAVGVERAILDGDGIS